jgi:hypothetical protein
MLLKANADSEAGMLPTPDVIDAMRRFNESMVKAGVLLDAAGLQASSQGARVRLRGSQRTVIDGPFTETKELVAGYWMIQVKSRAEAIEWARRCTTPKPEEELEIEVRQVHEAADCPVLRSVATG